MATMNPKKVGRPKKEKTAEEQRISEDRIKDQKRKYEASNKSARSERKRVSHLTDIEAQSQSSRQKRNTEKKKQERLTFYYGTKNCVEAEESLDIGDMSVKCIHCNGVSFRNEIGRSRHSCCHGGKVILPALSKYPDTLLKLLIEDTERSRHFRENIRSYNVAFAFASFNATAADIYGNGPYCVRVRGTATAMATTSLLSNVNPRFGQIYIYDANETINFRKSESTRKDILEELEVIFHGNPYAQNYKQLYDVFRETEDTSISLNFLSFAMDDQRRYNTPTANEIAAIIVTKDGTIPQNVDIRVFPKSAKEYDYISNTSHHADPMLFPLLFPSGDNGWSYKMKMSNMKNISPLQFYSSRISVRYGEFNPIFACGRLTQQYIINCYLTVESQRLKYIRLNQSALRTECYQGLVDHLQNSAANNAENVRVGNVLILPSSFQGCSRSMQQLYQDAMAICRKKGRPDLFITMTCNPKWPEIKRYLSTLPPNLCANDIPHVTSRIFYQKACHLISNLDKVFGPITAYVYTIEFQKRGLPHMHLLVTLQNKLLTADDVDKFISAEIPPKNTQPRLWYKVTKHMLHGPHKEGIACMNNDQKICTKKFPKPFSNKTDMTKCGFPKYRRPNNLCDMNTYHGKTNGKIVSVDNSMVVPYNPYLLMMYDCHINVEYCASIMGIKYIHKYIHKGHDKARVRIDNTRDEIKDFVDSRYLSASECAWRLLELPLHSRSHAVERLPVHLPGMNRVVFQEGNECEAIEKNQHTKLTAFFELNKHDAFAKSIKYEDIPMHYRWLNEKKMWQKRIRMTSVVSRIVSITPRAVELFHLKLLLRKSCGATSFKELRIVNGLEHNSFKEAAIAKGLVASDNQMIDVLTEAQTTLMPKQLRKFFVYMLLGCADISATELWEKFKYQLSEDTTLENALSLIGSILENENSSLESFGLPNTARIITEPTITNFTYHEKVFLDMHKMLNVEQLAAFNCLKEAIDNAVKENCFFVDGPGGSGKTFLYSCVINYALCTKRKIYSVAWTGIAAILLPFGRTAHKTFQLPLNLEEKSTLFWNNRTKETIRSTDIFLWDEASMIPLAALESVNSALQDICNNDKPFAGKIVILGGDFRQMLPVVRRGGKNQILESTIKRSSLWNYFRTLKLTRNMRANNHEQYSEWLLNIGNGNIDMFTVPDEMLCPNLVNAMYSFSQKDGFVNQAILTPRNDDVEKINKEILELLPGEFFFSESIDFVTTRGTDKADECNELNYPLEYVNSLTPSGFPPHRLCIKIGAIIMLIRNLCISDGLCNGTRLIVIEAKKNMLSCKIITGDKAGDTVYIPRVKLDSSSDTELPFVLHRTQFPVRIAFAMTINKSQGQSFESIGIYLSDHHPLFTHGQLYVALSRCKKYENIRIQLSESNKQKLIKNIVFKEVF